MKRAHVVANLKIATIIVAVVASQARLSHAANHEIQASFTRAVEHVAGHAAETGRAIIDSDASYELINKPLQSSSDASDVNDEGEAS